jgi:hypothetical protein
VEGLSREESVWERAVTWYRVVLTCDGVPPASGGEAAIAITEGFQKRTWHRNAGCTWDGKRLILTVENDFDPKGGALSDEFSDEITANIAEGFNGDIHVVLVSEVSE